MTSLSWRNRRCRRGTRASHRRRSSVLRHRAPSPHKRSPRRSRSSWRSCPLCTCPPGLCLRVMSRRRPGGAAPPSCWRSCPAHRRPDGVQAARQLPHRNGLPGRVQERPDGPSRPRRATQAAFWLQRRLSCQYPARNSGPFPNLGDASAAVGRRDEGCKSARSLSDVRGRKFGWLCRLCCGLGLRGIRRDTASYCS